jgi:hypothetical protein
MCGACYQRDLAMRNPEYRERVARRKLEWAQRAENRAARKKKYQSKYALLSRYGLTPETYAALFKAQGGGCAICRCDLSTVKVNIDHDHATGKTRGYGRRSSTWRRRERAYGAARWSVGTSTRRRT